jgi:HEAT repeat protein
MSYKKEAPIAATMTIASITHAASEASHKPVESLIGDLTSSDEGVSGQAWRTAGSYGAPAVKRVAALMSDANFEIARNARRALQNIVRHAGRPGAEKETRAVERELVALLKLPAPAVRKEAVWMLSEIGSPKATRAMAKLLTDPETREDARCAILRMPREQALDALNSAFRKSSDDFRYALADSLRALGQTFEGWPSRKLTPTAQTGVQPIPPK